MEAKEFLEEIDYYNTNIEGEQFEDLGIETLADMLEVYHQKKLKLLGIGDVMQRCFNAISEIEYNELEEGCGLEDQNIQDVYQAMEYGWNNAINASMEAINNVA